jgi:SAM-dependent methyltransferase
MNPDLYLAAARCEDEHWWFAARRAILSAVLERHPGSGTRRRILEVGCGSGGNLGMLAGHGEVFAVESDAQARLRAAARGIARVEAGALPARLPFDGLTFDLVAALDVLEHVADDRAALTALREKVSPGGMLLLTVPAFMWLWSRHDELSHHCRRYSLPGLSELVRSTGFEVTHASYFNTLLFAPGVGHIKLGNLLHSGAIDALRIPPAPVNALLREIFALERFLVPRVSLPFGISILLCGIAK